MRTTAKLCLVAIACGLVALQAVAFADAGPEAALVDAGSASEPVPVTTTTTTTTTTASDALHDPVSHPVAAIDDLKQAKRSGGWVLVAFALLVMIARQLGRVKTIPWLAWLGVGKAAIIAGGVTALAIAGFNALSEGGSYYSMLWAVAFTGLTYWNSALGPKPEKPVTA